MRFAPIAALPLVFTLVACEEGTGPLHRNESAFTFTTAVRPGMPVYVRNLRGEIAVEPSSDDSLRVTAALQWRGRPDRPRELSLSAANMPDGVLVCAHFGDVRCTKDDYSFNSDRGFRFGGASDVKVFYTVQVPAGVPLDLLGVDTQIRSASSGRVKARTLNGNVVVVTSVGPVRAETMNGNVDARMTTLAGPDSVIAATMNGNVALYLPANVVATVDASSTTGSVETDFASLDSARTSVKALSGGLRGGGTPVRARSLTGNIVLRQLDAQGRPINP